MRCRVVVATHRAEQTKRRIGLTRKGIIYELFLTNLPPDAFPPADVLALYLHRGAFEPALADEDEELDERLAGAVTLLVVRRHGVS